MPGENCIEQIRPGALFENFDLYNQEMAQVAERLKKLTSALIAKEGSIASNQFPFDHGQMLILWGGPGRGKTHLVEAIVNEIAARAPGVMNKIYLSRSDFTLDNIALASTYEKKPIIIMDDFFSKHQNINDLHNATDIRCFMNFVQMVYEERRFVIITCNFPFRDGILQRVEQVDSIGRITSRMKELLANSGEIQLVGKDYREELGKKNTGLIVF